jgi:hypothetical protein
MCGTMNPSGNATCGSCGARLAPLSASAGPETPPADSEVPEWLAQVVPTPSKQPDRQPSEPVPATEPSGSDDWMSRLRGALEQPAETELTGETATAEEAPDWLRDVAAPPASEPEFDLAARLRGAAEPPPATAPAAPPPAEEEVPDWLAQLAPTPASKPEPPAAPPPAEVPDWLTQLAATQPVKSEPPVAAPLPPPSEVQAPEWLTQLAPAAPSAAEPEIPDWLKELGGEPSAPAAPTPAPLIGEEAHEEMPAWLKDLGSLQAEPVAPPAAPEAPAEAPEQIKEPEPPVVTPGEAAGPFVAPVPPAAGETPAWLQELEPAAASAPQPSTPVETPVQPTPTPPPSEGGLEAAQLPSWLQALKPEAPETAATPEEQEPAETEGILAGLRGALPAAAIAWQPLGAGISTRPQITPDDLARAGALQDLIARGVTGPAQPKGKGKAQRFWSDAQRLVVFLVLAVAVVTPLWPGMNLGLVSAPRLEGAPNAMYERIDKLPPDAAVLVAFDYDATQSPEMDAQARVVMQHLFDRRAQVYFTSLYPAGPAAAQAVMIETGQLVSGTAPAKLVNLGYVPGQATAVAFINTTPYSMVIELAASPDTLRWWVEQLAARPDAPPLLSGVSAAAEPMSQPYLQSGQVKGMLVGIRDAAAYETKLKSLGQEQDLHRLAPLESLVTANVALIALIVLGGLVQLVSGGGSPSASGRVRT